MWFIGATLRRSPAGETSTLRAVSGGLDFADVNSVGFARKAAATGVDGLVLVASGAGGIPARRPPSRSWSGSRL